jgi:ferredoxin hydrogenase large subunit
MTAFTVNEKCNGCLACVENCPACALSYRDDRLQRTLMHNTALCARCGQCWRVCPQQAIEFQTLLQSAWDEVVTLELLRCSECGEVLYTTEYARCVQGKLHSEIRPLCSRHQEEHTRLAAAYPGGRSEHSEKQQDRRQPGHNGRNK